MEVYYYTMHSRVTDDYSSQQNNFIVTSRSSSQTFSSVYVYALIVFAKRNVRDDHRTSRVISYLLSWVIYNYILIYISSIRVGCIVYFKA